MLFLRIFFQSFPRWLRSWPYGLMVVGVCLCVLAAQFAVRLAAHFWVGCWVYFTTILLGLPTRLARRFQPVAGSVGTSMLGSKSGVLVSVRFFWNYTLFNYETCKIWIYLLRIGIGSAFSGDTGAVCILFWQNTRGVSENESRLHSVLTPAWASQLDSKETSRGFNFSRVRNFPCWWNQGLIRQAWLAQAFFLTWAGRKATSVSQFPDFWDQCDPFSAVSTPSLQVSTYFPAIFSSTLLFLYHSRFLLFFRLLPQF